MDATWPPGPDQGSSACRFGGAPSVELLAEKLARKGFWRWLAMAGALPAVAVDGKLVECCTQGPVSVDALRAAGVGAA